MTATTDPSQLSSDRLSLLYNISQAFNSSLDLDEVLNTVMDKVITVTKAERGFVMLRDEEGELDFKAARGIEHDTIEQPEFEVSRGIVESVAEGGEPLLTSDAMQDDRFSGRSSVINLGLRSIICAPLKIKDEVIGVVYVDNRLQAGIFLDADLELVNAISGSAAIAIENARLYQVAVEKGRMDQELKIARQVQTDLIPQNPPEIPNYELVAHWVPAREVAGDFYDFIELEDGRLGIVIADVVDKGMGAAMFMAYSRAVLRASAKSAADPAEAIGEMNRIICADSAYGMFLTLVYAILDPDKNELTYVNAGHNPPLMSKKSAKALKELTRTGMLVGVDETHEYEQETIALKAGDFICFFTDGVTEAHNKKQEQFGEERLTAVLRKAKGSNAEGILSEINKAVDLFVTSDTPFDDLTLVVLKRT